MKIEEISLIQIEWNDYNGIVISILEINNKALFHLNSSWKQFLIINIFFIEFTIYDKTP